MSCLYVRTCTAFIARLTIGIQEIQFVINMCVDQFAAKCKGVEMKISTSKFEAMVLNRKKVECLLRVGEEILPQVQEFKYLGVLFTSEGKMKREIDKWIGGLMRHLQ